MKRDTPCAGIEGLGPRLALAILHLGISQAELAKRIGSSPGFVSDVVRGMKKPGAEFLHSVQHTFGISVDWLLSGDGTMQGGSGINLELLRRLRLLVAVARAGVADDDPTAKALLLLIRDGRLGEVSADPALREFVEALCLDDEDLDLATEIYNGQLATEDPAARQRNALRAAVAYFEARKPFDRLAALAVPSEASSRL